jgi:hypothetical protein
MILELASEWVVFADFLRRIGLFPTTKKAMERLTKLEKGKKLRFVGRVMLSDVGHPTHVFTNRETGNRLEHDTFVSLIAALYWKHHPTMTDTGPERADLRFSGNGVVFLAEYDNNTEGDEVLRKRLAAYRNCPHTALWIAAGDYRCQKIHGLAKELKIPVFVGRFQDVLATPYGRVYADITGAYRQVSI